MDKGAQVESKVSQCMGACYHETPLLNSIYNQTFFKFSSSIKNSLAYCDGLAWFLRKRKGSGRLGDPVGTCWRP